MYPGDFVMDRIAIQSDKAKDKVAKVAIQYEIRFKLFEVQGAEAT